MDKLHLRLLFICISLTCASEISTDLKNVTFMYFDEKNEAFSFKAETNPYELLEHGFNPDLETKIVVHGFFSDCPYFCKGFVEAYDGNTYNVIGKINYNHQTKSNPKVPLLGLDWGPLAAIDNYLTACFNTPRVGYYAGKELVVDILIRALGQNPDKIHVIGHSLGAHVAGHLGRTVQTYLNLKIGRITGLYLQIVITFLKTLSKQD